MDYKAITQNTLIPIGSVAAIIAFVFWVSGFYNESKYTKEKVAYLEKRVEHVETKQQASDTFQATFLVQLTNIERTITELKNILTSKSITLTQ